MTKARERDTLRQVPIKCPHCGVDIHPFFWDDDQAFIVCGYCGRVMEIFRKAGETVRIEKA